jgi:hypothetical protein
MESKVDDVHVIVRSSHSGSQIGSGSKSDHCGSSEKCSLPSLSKATGSGIENAAAYSDEHSAPSQRVLDVEQDPKRLRMLQWKIDLHILPFLMFGLMLNFLDKAIYNVCDDRQPQGVTNIADL